MERLDQLLQLYKIPLVLSFIGVVLIIGGLYLSTPTQTAKKYPSKSIITSTEPNPNLNSTIKVDISGAVIKTGVYTLASDSRVEDAIKLAGGFNDLANQEYLQKTLNLSQKLTDGMKIYIPFKGEKLPLTPQTTVLSTQSTTNSLIGINTASQSQLEALSGIGPATAQKIIDKRPYISLEELYLKKAISKTLFEKIKISIDLN